MGFFYDYFLVVFVFTLVALIRVLVYQYTTPLDAQNKPIVEHAKPSGIDVVENIRKSYDLSIKESHEKEIKIKAIFIYPIRGVKGMKVKECEIGPYGIKKDRNWVIISKEKMKPIANNNNVIITFLR